MQSHQARYVTICQQVLALGLVCAALTPAANVISLDVVPHTPDNAAVIHDGAGETRLQLKAATTRGDAARSAPAVSRAATRSTRLVGASLGQQLS